MEKKDVFLCHSSVDKEWVEALGAKLEAETIGDRNISVFLDKWDIQPGDNLVWKLNEGLEKSHLLCIIMSPEMFSSDWCKLEVSSFLTQDPINRRGRILPLLLRDKHNTTGERIQIPPVLGTFVYLDFRDEKSFSRELKRLLARVRGEPQPRGQTRGRPTNPRRREHPEGGSAIQGLAKERHQADEVVEHLISNLLPVTPPTKVWSAPTSLSTKRDLHEFYTYPAFIVREKRLFTFEDLSKENHAFLDVVTDGEVKQHDFTTWYDNEASWRWTVELLNDTLRNHLWHQGVAFHPRSERYYFKRKGNTSVYVRWGSGDKRFVVRAPDADQPGGNWVHQAARLHFERLGNKVFLSIEPSWMFTVDGRQPVSREDSGPLAMQWGGKERNGTILRHTLMWSDVITRGQKTARIQAGTQTATIGRLPAVAQTSIGIAEDKVAMRALLEFTEVEQNLKEPTDAAFAYLPDSSAAPFAEKDAPNEIA